MTSKYWILTGSKGEKILTLFKVETDPVNESIQAYCIVDKQWEKTEYLWDLLAENDMRLYSITDEEGAKLELLMLEGDAH